MTKSEKTLRNISNLLSQELGYQTGEMFYTLYQDSDVTEVISIASGLLAELVGPEMAMKKIEEADKNETK